MAEASEEDCIADAKATTKKLNDMLNSGNLTGVITTATQQAPTCKDGDAQRAFAEPVLSALAGVKKGDIPGYLGRMAEHEREMLLKYVYYGFQSKPESATEFLSWQTAIVNKDGLGAIARVVCDIKRNVLALSD